MENQLVEEHHVLILGALKKCHVSTYHPQFEDYLQIARWTLIETHRRFIKEEKDMTSFHNYVFQRIYWKITDEIRKEMNRSEKLQTDSTEELLLELPDTSCDDLLEVTDILDKLSTQLTPQEKLFLEEAYLNELSVTDIARKYHVSRQTVYNWRDKVALKTIKYFKN
ncbi:sigma-70 family RNA polymerase sigma factor [Vagococcus sp.]|uniref:sigma-70 family RNA polymerase sigma factor n=1 Tax=Vagococcus sp. TaxID=1933889 RepID=UPI002FCA0AB3